MHRASAGVEHPAVRHTSIRLVQLPFRPLALENRFPDMENEDASQKPFQVSNCRQGRWKRMHKNSLFLKVGTPPNGMTDHGYKYSIESKIYSFFVV